MVAIKNMKLPKDCVDCKLCLLGYCSVTNRRIFESTRRKDCPLVEINPLTDDEKRIFLSAMIREKGICEAFDNEKVDDGSVKKLLPIVKKIERKVKKALWR